jgi:GntR family transcriptional regulator/MocR family aminotransferase
MRSLYGERQSVLVEAIHRELNGLIEVSRSDGGMHVVGWLPSGANDRQVSNVAKADDVYASPLSDCAFARLKRGGLLFGFAAFSPKQICDAVRRLSAGMNLLLRNAD